MKNPDPNVRSEFYRRAFVGFLATVLIGIIYPLLGAFVVTTLFCTAGLSLVIWIPLWSVLGKLLTQLYFTIRDRLQRI